METISKTHLTNLSPDELEAWFLALGERPFHARQTFKWIHARQAESFADMTDLRLVLREKLPDAATITTLRINHVTKTEDGATRKYLLELFDGKTVEAVLICHEDRRTVCVSCQVGCALGCTFCATAQMGFQRDLTAGEIVEQVYTVMRDSGERVTNVVFMGMGEPMLNYDAVITAADLLNIPHGLGIGARHITISTAGHVPGLRRFTKEGHPYRLAVSLNAPDDTSRTDIMPITRKWSIAELLDAVKTYIVTANKRMTFEYVLIGDVTDSPDKARALVQLLKGIHCAVNLIPYNPADDRLARPTPEAVDRFYRVLAHGQRAVTVRWSQGTDIQAACGQLATQKQDNKRVVQ